MVAVLSFVVTAPVRSRAADEYQIKAAFLPTFAQFVWWPSLPEPAQAPVIFGVLGENPFGDSLSRLAAGRTVHGRPIVVKRYDDVQRARHSQILFIGASNAPHLKEILAALADSPVLLISDIPEFVRAGGAIGLTLDEGRVRFEVNLGAITRSGIRIDARLLALAKAVRKGSARVTP